jgi:hypothetical protein
MHDTGILPREYAQRHEELVLKKALIFDTKYLAGLQSVQCFVFGHYHRLKAVPHLESRECLELNDGMLKQTIIAVVLACVGTALTHGANQAAPTLKFNAPSGWVEEKASSTMRVAQYKLPRAEGDSEDGSLVLYFFGQGQGGGAAANIERWIGQMKQTDGSDSKDKAKEESLTVNGLKITSVAVSGTYTAEMAPGSGTFHNNPNYRLRAAVIETPKGFYYLKLVGPEKTIAKWDKSVTEFVGSFRFE